MSSADSRWAIERGRNEVGRREPPTSPSKSTIAIAASGIPDRSVSTLPRYAAGEPAILAPNCPFPVPSSPFVSFSDDDHAPPVDVTAGMPGHRFPPTSFSIDRQTSVARGISRFGHRPVKLRAKDSRYSLAGSSREGSGEASRRWAKGGQKMKAR
ncbi:hypothetical protein KM043_012197 [Ampulex compressa]|nr:hypothetical protein KM043_012197 [Ampulex compressa]